MYYIFFYTLNVSPISQIHIRNYVLMFYLYVNKYILKQPFVEYFSPSNCQCGLFSRRHTIFQIFCISGRLAFQIHPNQWSSNAFLAISILQGHVLVENRHAVNGSSFTQKYNIRLTHWLYIPVCNR